MQILKKCQEHIKKRGKYRYYCICICKFGTVVDYGFKFSINSGKYEITNINFFLIANSV